MSTQKGNSYLDLAVIPQLRDAVLSINPVVVFAPTLTDILWCNAAGAHLFGGNGIADLLSMTVPRENPLIRQLHHAVEQMADQQSIIRGFRIHQGMRSQLLQFSIEKLDLPDGIAALKVTHLRLDHSAAPDENELAALTVEAFAGFADATAILDDHGLPLAHSSEFGDHAPDEQKLENLITELLNEEDRLVKRAVASAKGEYVAAGLARFSDAPGRNLIVIARSELHPETPLSLAAGASKPDETQQTGSDVSSADGTNQITRLKQVKETEDRADRDKTSGRDWRENYDERLPQDEHAERLEAQGESTPDTGLDDTLRISRPDLSIAGGSSHPTSEFISTEPNTLPPERPFPDSGQNTTKQSKKVAIGSRFAWATDAKARFTNVSEEFAILFGQQTEQLLGKSWSDLASEYGFDSDHEIARLLESQNTWSGKIVELPPNLGGDRMALELAALPAFDNTRQFSGFRGFGKVLEIVQGNSDEEYADQNSDDDREKSPGEKAADGMEPESPDDSHAIDANEPDIAISPADDDLHYREETQSQEYDSNIVPFSRTSGPGQGLSEQEMENLEAVRRHLEEEDPIVESENQSIDINAPVRPNTKILEKLPVGILVFRGDDLLYANQVFHEVSGYSTLDEIAEGGGLDALLDGETSSENRAAILRCAEGTTKNIYPVIHSIPWGDQTAMLMSFSPPDLVDLKSADVLEITKTSEIQGVLDTTNDGIVLMEADGTVISINAPGEALFGIDFDDATGKPFDQLFAPESYSTIRNYIANINETGVEHLMNDGEEAIALESSGGIIPVFVTIAQMKSTGKLCAVLRDITSWKKTEEELIQSRKQAERSSEQKSEFLARVSHEIRTPLNAIIGFSDVMIEERFGPIDNKRYREYLRDIKRSGTHVLDIVNELLDLSKIEAGKLDLSFEAVDLNEVVAETVALLQPQANASRTIIRTSLSRSVPKVVADPKSVRQIILNLVSNAIKFSKSNSQVIVSTVYESSGEVALRVRDTGNGMTSEEIKKAMEPFTQAHSPSESIPQGSGLGLPLTKALVEANRAFFELESEPGSGTIAHVQFPVQRVLSE